MKHTETYIFNKKENFIRNKAIETNIKNRVSWDFSATLYI